MKYELNANWYFNKLILLVETSPREDSFQDLIIYPLLDSILQSASIQEYELIDSKNFLKNNTKNHDRRAYSLLTKAVPDMLIAKDFYYNNRKQSKFTNIKVAIEVKDPNSNEMDLCGKLSDRVYLEIFSYLIFNKYVILTNVREWIFFQRKDITDNSLIDYIKIQKLCGFDIVEDCYNKNGDRPGRPLYVPKVEVMKEKWESLSENILWENLPKEINFENHDNVSFKDFEKLIEITDQNYLKKIKEYVEYCKETDSIELISYKGKLIPFNEDYYNRFRNITQVSDLCVDYHKWELLIKKLNNLINEID